MSSVILMPFESPLGPMTLASENDYLIGAWFDGQKYDRSILSGRDCRYGSTPVLIQSADWLGQYFAKSIPSSLPPLRFYGSDFRRMILKLLTEIPYGQTVTYGELASAAADQLGIMHMSAQAVGGAVGHNPISVIVPCHRVLGADGSLTGYAGGIERKIYLLRHEGARINTF